MSRSPWLSPRRWVILATAVMVVYFIFTAASNTLQAIQIDQDESNLRQEVDGLAQRFDQLTALRDYWKSDEYIEWVARRELGLVRPGELDLKDPVYVVRRPGGREVLWVCELTI